MHAAVAEVPERRRRHVVGRHQLVEAGQVGAQHRRGHGGVLPAGPGGTTGGRAPGHPGSVLADPPQARLHQRVLDDQRVERDPGRGQPLGPREDLVAVVAGDLDEEPGITLRQRRDGTLATPLTQHGEQSRVEALARGRAVGDDGGCGPSGLHDGAEPERHDDPDRSVHDQAHGRLGDHPERALGADQRLTEVEALGQQVLGGVAGDLSAEPVELRAHGGEVATHHLADPGDDALAAGDGRGAARVVAGPQGAAVGEEEPEARHVVGRAPVGEAARPAGVVADHPADGAARVRRGIGTEADAVRGGGLLQDRVHGARLDHRGAGVRVDGQDPVEVTGEVEDDPAAHGVAGDRRTRTAGGQRHAVLAGDGQRGGDLVDVTRPDDGQRRDPVEGGVRGVHRHGAGIGLRLQPGTGEGCEHVGSSGHE